MNHELFQAEVMAAIDALRADFKAALEIQRARIDEHGELIRAGIGRDADLYQQLANKADLVDGKVPVFQLPALAITNVTTVDDLAAMMALRGADEGDVAIVGFNDEGATQSFIYDGTGWVPMSTPVDVADEEIAAAVAAGLRTLKTHIVGTAGRIKVTETPDGYGIDIDPEYKGQKSITVIPALERSNTLSSETIEFLAVMREQALIQDEIERRDRLKEEHRLTLDELLAQLKNDYGLDVRALQEAAVASNRGGDEDWSKHFHGVCSRCTCHSKPCHCGCECCTGTES